MEVLDKIKKDLLKIRLGGKTIDPIRVSYCKRIGSRICVIGFVTGETIKVTCGIQTPDTMRISFAGTPKDLKTLLADYTEANGSC